MLLVLTLAAAAHADGPVASGALPSPVTDTVTRRWPSARIVSAATDDGEVEVVLAEGARRFEVALAPDGTWIETEEAVEVSQLPTAVVAAVEGRGKILGAERRTLPDGRTDYELLLRSRDGRVEIRVDPAGAVAPDEDEDDDDDEDKDDD